MPTYNPILPHVESASISPGSLLRVDGLPAPNAKCFSINIQSGQSLNPRSPILLHLSPVFTPPARVVRNSLHGDKWGPEESHGPPIPFSPGVPFQVIILVEELSFKIAVNGQHFCEFFHRIPVHQASHVSVDGDVSISFIDVSTHASAPPPAEHGPPAGMYPPLDGVMPQPPSGPYGDAPPYPNSGGGFGGNQSYPGAGYAPPAAATGYPAASPFGQPSPYDQPHAPPYGQPAAPYGQPAAPYGQPAAPYGQPAAPYGQPAAPYGQPAAPYGQPSQPYGQPAPPYGQPYAPPPAPYGAPPGHNGYPAQPYPGHPPPAQGVPKSGLGGIGAALGAGGIGAALGAATSGLFGKGSKSSGYPGHSSGPSGSTLGKGLAIGAGALAAGALIKHANPLKKIGKVFSYGSSSSSDSD